VRAVGRKRLGEPVAAGGENVADELDRPAAAEPTVRAQAQPHPVARPQLGAQHAERQIGVRQERLDCSTPLLAQLGDVGFGRAEQECRLALGRQRRGRVVGVEVLEPALGELVGELGMRGAAHPERVPGAEDVVQVPRLGQLRGTDAAPELVLALEHAHAPPAASEQSCAGE
jgi:hypothetical protein